MAQKTSDEFANSVASAPLNGWTEEEKEWLRTIGMTEDKPTDPVKFERYIRREYKAAMRYYKQRARDIPRMDPDRIDLSELDPD